ncbi:MAG: GNAT family N-acetyltransferase [Patescibacteria group bacterium]
MSEKEIRNIASPGRRQLISDNGIPVRSSENPDSHYHRNNISFGIGELVQMGEIEEPIHKEEKDLRRRLCDLKFKLTQDAMARLSIIEGNLSSDDYPRIHEMTKQILKEESERQKKIEKVESRLGEIIGKRYDFGSEDKYDLYVGKEGTLIYSVGTGERPGRELEKAWVPKKENIWTDVDPEWRPKIADIRERIQLSKRVADIHQIEVLPDHRGKGYAKALLDVALFDIEWTHGDIEFSIARVERDNPHGEQMVNVFKKAGFMTFHTSRIGFGDIGEQYTLLVRENSRMKGKV